MQTQTHSGCIAVVTKQ